MSRPMKMHCEKCGKDITIAGSQICSVCDPDIRAIITKSTPKTPQLCDECFKDHVVSHQPLGKQ